MTTFRVVSQDFRDFIGWMIEKEIIENDWQKIKQVFENPHDWMTHYLKFQEETYEKE